MTSFGRCTAALMLSTALIAAPLAPSRADLPVVDFGSISQQINSYITQVKQWIQEQLSFTTQLTQLAHELNTDLSTAMLVANWIHDPTLGGLLGLMNMAGLNVNLPINPYSLMSLTSGYGGMNGLTGILGNGSSRLSQLSSLAGSTYNDDQWYFCASSDFGCQRMQQSTAANAGTKAALANLYGDLVTHTQVLNQARTQLQSATDPKTVADLQAQVATEQAWITSQQAQATIVVGLAQAQQQTASQQDEQRWRNSWDGAAGILQQTPQGGQ